MSDYETVKYGQDGAVAIITIHRPDAMNSFNTELRRDLLAAFQRAAGVGPHVLVLVCETDVEVLVVVEHPRHRRLGSALLSLENQYGVRSPRPERSDQPSGDKD